MATLNNQRVTIVMILEGVTMGMEPIDSGIVQFTVIFTSSDMEPLR